MGGTMTDAELIELVQTKTPPELTSDEVSALGERLKESPALQQALGEHLEMERYLADVLGGVRISPEQILARADPSTAVRQRMRRLRRWVALSLFVVVACVIGLAWHLNRSGPGDDSDPGAVAVVSQTTQRRPGESSAAPTSGPRPTTASIAKTVPTEEPKTPALEAPRDTAAEPFALVEMREPGLSEAQLKAWFDPVEGQPHNFRVIPPAYMQAQTTEMSGLWRLRTAWKPGTSLRCLFRTLNTFKFHVWNGGEGITLELWRAATRYPYLPDLSLVAYRTTRTGKGPLPQTLVLAASDEGEFWRTRSQFVPSGYARLTSTPIDLRHENGLLTVSSGDVHILSVPFAAAPSEVYFEGEASFQSLGMAPLYPLPPGPAPLPIVLDVDKPAELKWLGNATNLIEHTDGSLEFFADKSTLRTVVSTFLPPPGVCETIVQLDGVMPGTGVYLGDEKGEIRYLVSFMRDETTNRTIVQEIAGYDLSSSLRFVPAARWPPAFVGDKVWLRILMASSQMKCWLSNDGVHWARAFESPSGRPGEACASLGLFCQPGEARRAIRLCRVQQRELSTLNALAPAELVRQAPAVPHTLYTAMGDWLAAAHASRPANVDPVVWSRACAIRALASGVSPNQAMAMLDHLLDQGLKRALPFDTKVRLIDEALMLVPKTEPRIAQHFVRYYERLGQALLAEGETRPYSRLRLALVQTPLWSSYAVDVFPESLAVSEMLDQAALGHWEEVETLARFGRIHRASPSIFDWAETLVGRRQAPKKKPGKRLSFPAGWQAALVLEQDKDGTTDLSEIEAGFRANSPREASRILTRLQGRGDRGLLPDFKDSQRLMSWPIALAGLSETHVELRALLRGEFAPEGRLQLRRALDEKDELALETLTLRHYGTEEAAEAHVWLGDRYLADGEPALAVGHYRQALRMTEGNLRRRIDDRLHLTAALLGQPVTAPPQADIEFGEMRLAPAALQELRKRRSGEGVDVRWTATLPPQLAPAATAFEVVPRGRFEGEVGDKPEVLPAFYGTRLPPTFDWFAHQVALAVQGERLFVSNRFQVDCYDVPSGKLQWRIPLSREPGRKEMPGTAYEYPLTPMRPVIAGPHLFVRRLMRGPVIPPNTPIISIATLACLDAATGKVLWNTNNHQTAQLHYVSDPIVIQDQVFALGQRQSGEGDWALTLLVHNRADGVVLVERSLGRVRSSFDEQRGCQLTALDDACLATVGGSIICFDFAGNLRWARRPLWVPAEADPHWLMQSHDPPLIAGERCFIVQPGVLTLTCLAPETGRLHWQKPIYGLRRIAGLVDDRLVVQTNSGFVCLEASSGKELWRHDAAPVLSSLCGGPGGLVYASSEAVLGEKELHRPYLVWVDLQSGREKARFSLFGLGQVDPRLGPLFVAGDRLWAFAGKGHGLTRDLIELVPKGEALAATPAATEWDEWTSSVPRSLRTAAARVLPGWTVFNGKPHARAGLVAEHQGDRDVLAAPASFVIGRHIDVPNTEKPRLLLRVTNEVKAHCLVAVDIDGKQVWQQLLSHNVTGDKWVDWTVDLSSYKGKRLWIVVRHLPRDADTACSLWSKIELRE
jgi:outer membrane protein assembly factor BamB